MDQTTVAWLAGLIDGEGTISIVSGARRVKGVRRPQYRVVCKVYNSNRSLMDALVERTSAGRINGPYSYGDGARRPMYQWFMNTQEMTVWLPELLPWLVIKKRQAELALAAIEVKASALPTPGVQCVRNPQNDEALDALRIEIQALNQSGGLSAGTLQVP